MSDQQRQIYQTDGDRYEALIAREDYMGNIEKALDEIINVDGLDVLDLGAGTGRLAVMFAPRARSMRAFDVSEEMLRVCRTRFEASGLSNWKVDVADHRQLPVNDSSADLVVSGWSVSYLAVWNPETWRAELEKWLGEMKRVLAPGGRLLILHTDSSRSLNLLHGRLDGAVNRDFLPPVGAVAPLLEETGLCVLRAEENDSLYWLEARKPS